VFSTPIWQRCWEVSGQYIAVNSGYLFTAIKEVAGIGFLQLSDMHRMQQTYHGVLKFCCWNLRLSTLSALFTYFILLNIYFYSFLLSFTSVYLVIVGVEVIVALDLTQ